MKTQHQSESDVQSSFSERILIKKCHCCGGIQEDVQEPTRCNTCKKSFLPSNYFGKVHAKNSREFRELFSEICELQEEDMIKGLNVLW